MTRELSTEAEMLKRVKKWDEIKKEYDQVDLKGAILIDGHHVFLKIIQEIVDFNNDPEGWIGAQKIKLFKQKADGFLNRLKKTETFSLDPLVVGQFYARLVLGLSTFAHKHVYEKTFKDGRKIIFDEHRLNPNLPAFLKEHPPKDHVVINAQSRTSVFDAAMPDKDDLMKSFKRALKKNLRENKHKNARNIQEFIEELEDGNWSFWLNHEVGHVTVPYNLKNETLEILGMNVLRGEWQLTALVREINAYKGRRESKEKGVDTSLVIKGCELANDKDCDWVCLITNDGDHAPLIRHLQSKGKEVYLNAITERKKFAKTLIAALASEEHSLSIADTLGFISGGTKKESQFGERDAVQQWLLMQASIELDHEDRGWPPPSQDMLESIWQNFPYGFRLVK